MMARTPQWSYPNMIRFVCPSLARDVSLILRRAAFLRMPFGEIFGDFEEQEGEIRMRFLSLLKEKLELLIEQEEDDAKREALEFLAGAVGTRYMKGPLE